MPPYSASYGAWSVVTAVVLGVLLLLKLLTSRGAKKNLPPGPRGLPVIGSMHLLGKYPHEDLAKLAETYGPVMALWFGAKLAVVASSPAAAEEILKTQGPNFSSRLPTSFGELLLPDDIAMQSDSPTRLHLKKILHTHLSTTRQLQQSTNVRTQEITHLLHMMPQDGATAVPVRTYIEVVVTNIISQMVLKKRFMDLATGKGDEGQELEQVRNFKEITDALAKYALHVDPGDFIPLFKWMDIQGIRKQYRMLRKRMDKFMSKIISEHLVQRKNGSVLEKDMKDMADVLLDSMEDETLRFDITQQHVNSLLWNAFIGGTSTITDAIEWTLAECIHNPTIMKKAQAELDVVVGKSKQVEDADIPNLKYLQAIVKENFRLHPLSPILIPHMTINACTVFGYDIPARTVAFVNVGAIARDPSIWEDPLTFMPERFLEGMPHANTDVQGKHFELLPFGSGRRGCPGIVLGNAIVHILLATLLQSFDWSLPNDLQPRDLNMREAEGVMSTRAEHLIAIPKARL